MNSPTLRDLYDQIVMAGPDHFDMDTWLADNETFNGEFDNDGFRVIDSVKSVGDYNFTQCGTVGCLAGHGANLMAQCGINTATWGLMGLTTTPVAEHYDLSPYLFYVEKWSAVPYRDTDLFTHYLTMEYAGIDKSLAQYTAVVDWLEWELKNRES